jgi:putative SOS response-associated peptidase YedK
MEEEIIEIREIMREINRRYAGTPEHALIKSGQIFPANIVPVLSQQKKDTEAHLFSWGFPRWQGKGLIINARSETVTEKPLFRQAFLSRRCIIPSTGFYEWKHIDGQKKKDKYLLRISDYPVLYMAGIYTRFEKADINMPGFVILTTTANSSIKAIHDRMPVIIQPHEKDAWLTDESFAHYVIDREGPLLEAAKV